ncbi:hypothetical protein OAG52_02675 [Verrucomicrobia bacterium]|nr:hypothetical protein [Verrucomicrobiota bacterium]
MYALAIIVAVSLNPAQALRMGDMPSEVQTKNAQPVSRLLTLKLPLRQPVFHWSFLSRNDFLAGRLVLHVVRDGKSTLITIFDDGKFSDGWEAIDVPNPKAGELYFQFQSSKKYLTAPGDRLRIELLVKRDLNGIGPTDTGILPAGSYTSEGSYSGLLDEYALPGQIKDLPDETVAKLREAYEYKAFLENWEQEWSLKMTGEEGWLTPVQRKAFENLQKQMAEEDLRKK